VIIVNGFIGLSFGMIIFTSAIEAIPKDLMNASLVDGSTLLQRVRYVILPMLRWPLLFVVTYQTLSLLTSFEQILLLTNGGPDHYQTEVWALTAYHRALSNYFGNAQWGYGSAFAVVLVIVGVVLAVIYMRVFRFRELVAEPKIEG
jgi:inositol-phosphate transport system permease protein